MAIVRSQNQFSIFNTSGGYTDIAYNAGTGSGRILVVVTGSAYSRTYGPTYNGVAMTSIESQCYYGLISIYYLIDPAEGSNTLRWYSSSDDHCVYFAFILTGCAASPIGVHGKAYVAESGTEVTKALGNASAGSYIIAAALRGNNSTVTWANSLSAISNQANSWYGQIADRTLSAAEALTVGYSIATTNTILLLGVEFLLEVFAPTVTTQDASSITSTSFTGNGNITATGGANATRRGFCYKVGTSGDPTTSDSTAYDNEDFGTGAFTKSITGLTPNTSYRVRAYAVNSAGTGYGATVQITTLIEPTVTTQDATDIEKNSITCNGNITATGGVNPTRRGFCYKEGVSGDPIITDGNIFEDGDFGTGAFDLPIP